MSPSVPPALVPPPPALATPPDEPDMLGGDVSEVDVREVAVAGARAPPRIWAQPADFAELAEVEGLLAMLRWGLGTAFALFIALTVARR